MDPLQPIVRERSYAIEEIRSHSSVLTNLRLDVIFSLIDRRKLDAWDNPILDNIKRYFSSLYTAYDNVWVVLDENEVNEIKDLFNSYFAIFTSLINEKNRTVSSAYIMLAILDNVNRQIKGSLQKKSYFFKLGTPDVKGIDRSYQVIKTGGGLFGFKPSTKKLP